MPLIYTTYGIMAISKRHKRRLSYRRYFLYSIYEYMNNHSHYAAYSQLHSINDNASVNHG